VFFLRAAFFSPHSSGVANMYVIGFYGVSVGKRRASVTLKLTSSNRSQVAPPNTQGAKAWKLADQRVSGSIKETFPPPQS
jgi:hypothetical protein